MARGPLPNPQSRRRNAPTIASSELPAAGRPGRAPACPYALAAAGKAWWRWAWKLPQATRWTDGDLYFVARRALLEDEHAALGDYDAADFARVLGMGEEDGPGELEWFIGTLKRLAGGGSTLKREMRELDNRLGLNPKAMADLRWTIAEKPAPAEPKKGGDVSDLDAYRSRVG